MKRKPGFTVWELMVAISIILILSFIFFGVFRRSVRKAKILSCSGNMSQLAIALSSYVSDNNEFVPPWPTHSEAEILPNSRSRDPHIVLVGAPDKWKACLMERGANEEAFWCPLDKHRGTDFKAMFDRENDDRQKYTSYMTTFFCRRYKLIDGNGHILASPSRIPNSSQVEYLFEAFWDLDGKGKLGGPHGVWGYAMYFDYHVALVPDR